MLHCDDIIMVMEEGDFYNHHDDGSSEIEHLESRSVFLVLGEAYSGCGKDIYRMTPINMQDGKVYKLRYDKDRMKLL